MKGMNELSAANVVVAKIGFIIAPGIISLAGYM